jgi:predicted phage baseplate assembly protein
VKITPRNPMAARGGTAPEPSAEVKLFAPHAFRTTLERAITAEDYAELVMRDFGRRVQRAAATLRWTGSWYEVLVAVDPKAEVEEEHSLLDEIGRHLRRYRRIGHDVRVALACYVPLDIEITVCVQPDYLRAHVKAAVANLLSNQKLPDNSCGFFHPDNLTFGQGVFVSKIVAAVQSVSGVESVIVKKLKRLDEAMEDVPQDGVLKFGPLEVARLDNDPSFPENGVLTLNVGGGR